MYIWVVYDGLEIDFALEYIQKIDQSIRDISRILVICLDPLKYEILLSKVAPTATLARSMNRIKAEISIEAIQKDTVCAFLSIDNM